ncbi:hypothetical protein F0562_025626 [Nyssa sinensis]|uniref:Uncharacterized protein n=1 Tax=Nyssa sinensis TaxID=561372 RepID=A0A5J5B8J0_9ASTE|nr:hypothetical protein F0562_025626 [Nyssa sinensis]
MRGGAVRKRNNESLLTRAVDSVFAFVRFAEFEILFVLFFVIAFIIFKDLSFRSIPLQKMVAWAQVALKVGSGEGKQSAVFSNGFR